MSNYKDANKNNVKKDMYHIHNKSYKDLYSKTEIKAIKH